METEIGMLSESFGFIIEEIFCASEFKSEKDATSTACPMTLPPG